MDQMAQKWWRQTRDCGRYRTAAFGKIYNILIMPDERPKR
jgi:hypothetical protein